MFRITKVFGIGKTPPPCWEKFRNKDVFFESVPKFLLRGGHTDVVRVLLDHGASIEGPPQPPPGQPKHFPGNMNAWNWERRVGTSKSFGGSERLFRQPLHKVIKKVSRHPPDRGRGIKLNSNSKTAHRCRRKSLSKTGE